MSDILKSSQERSRKRKQLLAQTVGNEYFANNKVCGTIGVNYVYMYLL